MSVMNERVGSFGVLVHYALQYRCTGVLFRRHQYSIPAYYLTLQLCGDAHKVLEESTVHGARLPQPHAGAIRPHVRDGHVLLTLGSQLKTCRPERLT